MHLLWMVALLSLVHAEAQNSTEVKVKVGGDVTLTCPDDVGDLYWYVQIHGNISVFIGRTFSGRQEHNHCSPSSTSKYQLSASRLLITNTTADDCRAYTCGRKSKGVIVYLNTFHLVSGQSELT